MPIYEYQCKKCGQFEHMQRITDPPLTRCPSCRGKVTKLISNTSFQLKGSGWYATDYARKDSKGKDGSSPSEGKTDSASESKTEKGGTAEKGAAEKKETKPAASAAA